MRSIMGSTKQAVFTTNAPEPIGTYSQAVRVGNLVFVSGQIAIDPSTNKLDTKTFEDQVIRVFTNLEAICVSVGGNLNNIVKLNLYLTNLCNFNIVNELMARYFTEPYPARAVVQVSALPKNVDFEADAVMHID